MCSIIFGYRKSLWIKERGGGERNKIFVENLLSQGAETLRREPFCAELQNFLVAEKFMDERGERIKIFRRNVFFVSKCRKFPAGVIFKCLLSFEYRTSFE